MSAYRTPAKRFEAPIRVAPLPRRLRARKFLARAIVTYYEALVTNAILLILPAGLYLTVGPKGAGCGLLIILGGNLLFGGIALAGRIHAWAEKTAKGDS